jgi:hypothetical protein
LKIKGKEIIIKASRKKTVLSKKEQQVGVNFSMGTSESLRNTEEYLVKVLIDRQYFEPGNLQLEM